MKNVTTKPTKFKVVVNPFTKEVTISTSQESLDLVFKETDEWRGFKINGKEFDAHFCYEHSLNEEKPFFSLSIYPVVNNKIMTQNAQYVELSFVSPNFDTNK